MKPIVRNPGTVTAGNASGVNDGAAAMILASEAAVKKHGLTPRARILGLASAAVPPRIMGIGPVPATKKLMERLGIKISDFDLIELNEAFASQGIACLRQLGVKDDADFVNPHGGAIALGHPLGMSGARLALTAVHGMEKRGGKLALATMCVGVGQGVAVAIEKTELKQLFGRGAKQSFPELVMSYNDLAARLATKLQSNFAPRARCEGGIRHDIGLSSAKSRGASAAAVARLQEHGQALAAQSR